MKKIILFLILASSNSFGDWGDTYYCTMTSWTFTDLRGQTRDIGGGTPFKFQLSKEKKSMIFDNSVAFYKDKFKIMDMYLDQTKDTINDVWYAGTLDVTVLYNEGDLIYASAVINGTESKTGTCSKF
jgi:hypothetical protein